MSRPKPKIDIGTPSGAPGGLQNPFLGLDASGLPEGQVPDEPQESNDPDEHSVNATGGRLVLRKEKAHRSGKTVTVISGFSSDTDTEALEVLAHDLKRACGTGGTVKETEIEIQGEKWLELAALLRKRGYRIAGLGA